MIEHIEWTSYFSMYAFGSHCVKTEYTNTHTHVCVWIYACTSAILVVKHWHFTMVFLAKFIRWLKNYPYAIFKLDGINKDSLHCGLLR